VALAVFEYGDTADWLSARTRYVYLVRAANDRSVYAVALPAAQSIRAKFVQPDPAHRSISTAVCGLVPFVQSNLIALRPLAAARSADGASGVEPVTTIVVVVVFVAPSLSVTVSDAVYVAGPGYMCAVCLPTPNWPSPNVQDHATIEPSASEDAEPSNVTVSGPGPDVGVAIMTAVGA
jgi:hypothetical protein